MWPLGSASASTSGPGIRCACSVSREALAPGERRMCCFATAITRSAVEFRTFRSSSSAVNPF